MAGPNRNDYEDKGKNYGGFEVPRIEKPLKVVNTQELTYDELPSYLGEDNPYIKGLTQERFNKIAADQATQDFRDDAVAINADRMAQQEAYDKQTQKDEVAAQNAEWQSRISQFETTLNQLGQGEDVKEGLGNVADLAATLLALEGDSEEEVSARQTAAAIFSQYQGQLQPHIEAKLGEEWWLNNYQKINENLPPPEELGFWDRWKGNAAAGAGAIGSIPGVSNVGGYLLNILSQTGQGAAYTLAGLDTAIRGGDENVSRGDALRFAASSAGRIGTGLAESLVGREGNNAERLITSNGQTYSVDQNADGTISLREALGVTNELGEEGVNLATGLDMLTGGRLNQGTAERIVGGFDTVGLAAIDPLSWTQMGTPQKVQAGLATLSRSESTAARMAATVLRNGGSLDEMDDIARTAARAEWAEATALAAERWSAKTIAKNAGEAPWRAARKTADELARLRDAGVTRQVDKIEQAVRQGSVPGLRVGGTTVIPMRRVYDALGIIDSRLASSSVWAERFTQLADIKKPDDLLRFVHEFDGQAIPENFRQEMRSWSALSDALTDEPEAFLDNLLQRSPDADQAMDEIEAFGRALYGDETANKWRNFYETEWSRDYVAPTAPRVTTPAIGDEIATGAKTAKQRQEYEDLWYRLTNDDGVRALDGTVPADEASWTQELADQAAARSDDTRGRPADFQQAAATADNQTAREINETLTRLRRAGDLAAADEVAAVHQKTAQYIRRQRSVDALDLTEEASLKVKENLDIITNPGRWTREELGLSGLRGLYSRDTVAGRFYQRLTNKFSTFANVRNDAALGSDVARNLDQAANEAEAIRRMSMDMADMLDVDPRGNSRLVQAAAKEFDTEDGWARAVDSALSSPDGGQSYAQAMLANGKPQTAQLINALRAVGDDILEMSVASGADRDILLANKGYIPRVSTEGAKEVAQAAAGQGNGELDKVFTKMGLLDKPNATQMSQVDAGERLGQSGFLKKRTYEEDIKSIYDVNAKAREDLMKAGLHPDIAKDFQLYETNAVTSFMLRSKAAQEARVYSDIIFAMADEVAPGGMKLAYVAKSKDEIPDTFLRLKGDQAGFDSLNYTKQNLPNGGAVWIQNDVKAAIDETRRIVGSQADMTAARKLATAHNNVWGTFATVLNPAFHARNAVGNAFNMTLAGVRDPSVFADAFRIQKAQGRVTKIMTNEGLSFEEALKSLDDIDPRSVELIRDIRKYDLISSNRVTDMLNELDITTAEAGNSLTGLAPVRAGRALGTAVEGNARLALYIDGINKGMDPRTAAQRVRTFLFDYSDLTTFEGDTIRQLSRFYTFTRKNTALQARMLATNPGVTVNAQRMVEEMQDNVMAAFGFERDETGQVVAPPWAGPFAHTYEGGMSAEVETTFSAGLESAQQITDLVAMPLWITNTIANGDGESLQDRMRSALNLLSGGPIEAATYAMEQATQTDSFTGRSLDYVDESGVDRLLRFTDILLPAGSMVNRNIQGYKEHGNERLANIILGMSVRYDDRTQDMKDKDAGDGVTSSEMLMMFEEMDQALREAQKEVPKEKRLTVDDLVEMGNIQTRNDVLQYILYTGRAPDNFTQADREWMEKQVPKTILKDLGLYTDTGESNTSDLSPEAAARKAQERIAAIEALGLPLDQAMKDNILKYSLGLNIGELEGDIGAGAYRPVAPRKTGDTADPDEVSAANKEFMSDVLELMGRGSVEDFVADNPILTKFTTDVDKMRRQGFTEDEIASDIIDGLSRERTALIFGEDALDDTMSYKPLTAEELVKLDKQIAAAAEELSWLMMYQFGRQPTPQERDYYIEQIVFTGPEQEALGIDKYSAPSRKNVTSDETWDTRRIQKLEQLGESLPGYGS